MSTTAEQAPSVAVVAAIVAGEPDAMPETLAAIRSQVYGPRHIVVVGGGSSWRESADVEQVRWSTSLTGLLETAALDATHIWVLRSGALPRPDALRALLSDSERAGAPLACSKILDRETPDRLISVGLATDVFDVAYVGLDDEEVDVGQYDVVRDVAAVDGTSVLIRRDLARGLDGFDPLMAPAAAAIDLSQRARLRAARVVVVPSSEVEYSRDAGGAPGWREDAGSIRAMLKAYGPLTLLWALPLAWAIGLLEAILGPFVGRWTFVRWVRAWLWNLTHLYSTLKGRRAARRGNVLSDAELYRYQVRGSVKMRSLFDRAARRLTRRLGPDERSSLTDFGRELRRPAFLAGLMAVLFVAAATRAVWQTGFPASGYSLPLPSSGLDALRAYAGGWNPAGFGSGEALPPLIGLAGGVQAILFDSAALATAALVVGAFLSGIWGTTRLVRTWDIGPVAGIMAGAALMAGPAARALAADTGVGALLGMGVLPWAIRVALVRWPAHWRMRAGRLARAAWITGLVGLLSPQLVIVPVGALALLALLNVTDRAAWRAAAVAGVGALVALPTLLPWLDAVDISSYLDRGTAFWTIGLVPAVALGIAFAATVVAVPARLALIAGWGGSVTAAGAILARSGDFGPGREAEHLGLAIASLGTAIVVGTAIEGVRRVVEITGWRRMVVGVGAAAATVVAGSALLVVVSGRAGLPAPTLADRIGFVAAADGEPSASRILLIGPTEALPGESRTVRGAGYRVVSAPMPEMWEAWLPRPGTADLALEADLEAMIDGDTFRAGEVLAAYGIRWVISLGDTPLEDVFGSQLDLVPLGTRDGAAFTVEGDAPVRAVSEGGAPWSKTAWGYSGDAGSDRVLLAESFDARWGPEPAAEGPFISVASGDGEARFSPSDRRRTQAWIAGALFGLLGILSWVGRERT